MSEINEYLIKLSNQLTTGKDERDKINKSYDYLEGKIYEHFRSRLNAVRIFGSYERGTELPQGVDATSDVDVLIIFKTPEFQPQTILKHLTEFADKIYPRSQVVPDHPAVTIELDHIRFELVPAYIFDNEIKIPAPRNKDLNWITTEPSQLKNDLTTKNLAQNQMITPLIKLIKYINVRSGKPIDSYKIDRFAIKNEYKAKMLEDYFFEFLNAFNPKRLTDQQQQFVAELKARRANLIRLAGGNDMASYINQELQKFLPLIN